MVGRRPPLGLGEGDPFLGGHTGDRSKNFGVVKRTEVSERWFIRIQGRWTGSRVSTGTLQEETSIETSLQLHRR